MNQEPTAFPLDSIRKALREAGIAGWLFYDFRGLDPIARKILGLDPAGFGTRRWFYLVPAEGEPVKLVHRIEPAALDAVPGKSITYLSWESLREGLATMLQGLRTVAMQYSPKNEVPYVSRVDGGTVELVRSMKVDVVTSADLVQLFAVVLSPSQLESHRRAGKALRKLMDEVFNHVAAAVRSGQSITERSVVGFLQMRMAEYELVYDHPAIVAVNAHAADPHFDVPATGSAPVRRGDLLLVDMWAKERQSGAIYADITWTAYVGDRVPEEMQAVFRVVRDARNAAIALAGERFRAGTPVRGFELDRATRKVIEAAGYGKHFIHRTGHSIHEEVHGNGANLDDLETHDTRLILPQTVFSVEPGIYLPGRFGIRSEVDVCHNGKDAEVTGPPHQEELAALLA